MVVTTVDGSFGNPAETPLEGQVVEIPLFTRFNDHPRWFSRRISEPSTVVHCLGWCHIMTFSRGLRSQEGNVRVQSPVVEDAIFFGRRDWKGWEKYTENQWKNHTKPPRTKRAPSQTSMVHVFFGW